jgi:molecular chaperone DnaK
VNIIGFDFGTTNSLISVIRGGRPIYFLDEEQRPIQSVVCYEGAQTIVGRAAKERLSQAGLGVQRNIIRSPKMYLGRDSVFVEGVERSPISVVADVVQHVVDVATASRGREMGEVDGAVVTIPVDMEGYRRHALREAFNLAGMRILQFVHEPLAALYGFFRGRDLEAMIRQYDKKLVLVFDWGGGTLDLTLCRPVGNTVVQVKNDGTDEVGGDVFDETLMNSLVQKVSKIRGLDENVEIQPQAKARLMDRCERAKIDLSNRSNVSIYVGSFFRGEEDDDFDYSLSQNELEHIVSPLLDKGFNRIKKVLSDAGYEPEQVALCIATGGMSNMPAVRQRLHEWFGPERVQVPDGTATLIAEGAAWIAADEVGLQLAKNVELVLARDSYLPLVKAGTMMPREGEVQKETFQLYCTDPRDGLAKFQICAPRKPGSSVLPGEPRANLGNLTVQVDSKAKAFHERLELDVSINDDLILETHVRSLNRRDDDGCEVHNLEFGLQFPNIEKSGSPDDDLSNSTSAQEQTRMPGSITVRANIADRIDLSLVPGEYLYEYDEHYFDQRRDPPKHQVVEKLYYQPCSICRRASNDPVCRCVSQPNV